MLPEPTSFLNVHMYGVMVTIGILCAFTILLWLCRKKQTDSKFAAFLFYNSLSSIAVGFCFVFICNLSFNRSLYKKLVNIQRRSSLFKRHLPIHCCVNIINLHNFNVKYNF